MSSHNIDSSNNTTENESIDDNIYFDVNSLPPNDLYESDNETSTIINSVITKRIKIYNDDKESYMNNSFALENNDELDDQLDHQLDHQQSQDDEGESEQDDKQDDEDDEGESEQDDKQDDEDEDDEGEQDDQQYEDDEENKAIIKVPKFLSFDDVQGILDYSSSKQQYFSSAFDIVSTYLKGQKIIYTEAYEHCTLYLNMLMLPAIFLSALASVLSFSFEGQEWGSIVVASINAFNGFLLSVVNYSKLDAASEAHRITSHQYDKLQSMCEFTSGSLFLFPNPSQYDEEQFDSQKTLNEINVAKEKMDTIESKVKDIKDTNNFIIPSKIRKNFINIYYTNVFSLIKRITEAQSKIVIDMKNLLNRSFQLQHKINKRQITNDEYIDYMRLNTYLNQYHKEYIEIQGAYSQIDEMFKSEVRKAEKRKCKNKFYSLFCCRNKEEEEKENKVTESELIQRIHNIKLRSKMRYNMNKKQTNFINPDHVVNISEHLK